MADPTQIHQILMNLITNAAQAMANMAENKKIIVSSKLANGQVIVKVSDSGPGVNPSDQLKIFDPFFTTKEKGEGTGMGLAVVHGIVRDHGGVITVYSEPEIGTTFNVYLPLLQSPVNVSPEIRLAPRQGNETVFG